MEIPLNMPTKTLIRHSTNLILNRPSALLGLTRWHQVKWMILCSKNFAKEDYKHLNCSKMDSLILSLPQIRCLTSSWTVLGSSASYAGSNSSASGVSATSSSGSWATASWIGVAGALERARFVGALLLASSSGLYNFLDRSIGFLFKRVSAQANLMTLSCIGSPVKEVWNANLGWLSKYSLAYDLAMGC